jgi:fructuronate reductase
MLNGAHSALAYLGLERGYTFVHQAIADPAIRQLVERLMRREAATSFAPAPEQDLADYADALLARFANPALEHRLLQIAMDGSQKIPQRWLATLAHHQREAKQCPAILAGLGAWLRHIRGDNGLVDDPMAESLLGAWAGGEASVVDTLFGAQGLLPSAWLPTDRDRAAVMALN